jgi:hypothetical protein
VTEDTTGLALVREALTYPVAGDDGWKRLLVGGVATILVVPVFGYLHRVLRASDDGSGPPGFDGLTDLFLDGLRMLLLVAFVVAVAGTSALLVSNQLSSLLAGGVGTLPRGDELGVFALSVVVAVAGVFFGPAAVAHAAVERSVWAAGEYREFVRAALTRPYAAMWLNGLGITLVGTALGLVLGRVLVGVWVQFYTFVVVTYLVGRGYSAGRGRRPAGFVGEPERRAT